VKPHEIAPSARVPVGVTVTTVQPSAPRRIARRMPFIEERASDAGQSRSCECASIGNVKSLAAGQCENLMSTATMLGDAVPINR